MSEVGFEILKTEETENSGIKYYNINVSNSEVERDPDIVRLCADVGILEYVKSETGYWIDDVNLIGAKICRCSKCDFIIPKPRIKNNFCLNCGTKMEGYK